MGLMMEHCEKTGYFRDPDRGRSHGWIGRYRSRTDGGRRGHNKGRSGWGK